MEAELWFEEFVTTIANRMPDVKRRELPSCMTISQVYEMYSESVKTHLSQTHFRRMWTEDFKDVIIPKVNTMYLWQLHIIPKDVTLFNLLFFYQVNHS